MKFESDLEPMTKVMIDGDESLVGRVTSYQFRPTSDGKGVHQTLEVSYVHNGASAAPWVERSRLTVKR